jgi:hypothetical protein
MQANGSLACFQPPPLPSPDPPLQGCALSSNVVRIVIGDGGKVSTDVVIRQPWLKVS